MKLIALIAGVLALGTSLNVRPQEENHEQFPPPGYNMLWQPW